MNTMAQASEREAVIKAIAAYIISITKRAPTATKPTPAEIQALPEILQVYLHFTQAHM